LEGCRLKTLEHDLRDVALTCAQRVIEVVTAGEVRQEGGVMKWLVLSRRPMQRVMAIVLLAATVALALAADEKPPTRERPAAGAYTCAGKRTCSQMTTCEEATFYLTQCGVARLDGDKDGVPCESLCR
jgi:Excalibur calcium-binding domain